MKYILIIIITFLSLLAIPRHGFCQHLDGMYYLMFSLSEKQQLNTLAGLQWFYPGDIIKSEGNNLFSLYWKGSNYFTTTKNMDAVEVLNNGDIIFSLSSDWGSYGDEDLIKWTPDIGFSMYWDASLYGLPGDNDLDAVHIANDGSLIFSLWRQWGSFYNDDLIQWNPGSGFSMYWDPPYFTGNLDAGDLLLNNDILFSVNNQWIYSGITYETNDIIKYCFATNSYSLAWDASSFGLGTGSGWNMDAFTTVPIPEPGALPMLGSGMLGLGFMGWYRKRRSIGEK